MGSAQMTNAHKNSGVGDKIGRLLRQPVAKLEQAADRDFNIAVDAVPKQLPPSLRQSLARGLKKCASAPSATGSCEQKLWFSFFFDGAENNLRADVESAKHSNVKKLYCAHLGDKNVGDEGGGTEYLEIYKFYIPGIGTYFRDIGDPGGTDMGLAKGTRFVELAHDSELFADSLCGGHIVLVWISIRN